MRKIVKKFSFKIIKLLNMTDISFKNIIKAKKIIFMFHDVSDNPKEFYLGCKNSLTDLATGVQL